MRCTTSTDIFSLKTLTVGSGGSWATSDSPAALSDTLRSSRDVVEVWEVSEGYIDPWNGVSNGLAIVLVLRLALLADQRQGLLQARATVFQSSVEDLQYSNCKRSSGQNQFPNSHNPYTVIDGATQPHRRSTDVVRFTYKGALDLYVSHELRGHCGQSSRQYVGEDAAHLE